MAALFDASDEPLIVNARRAGVSLIANLVLTLVFGVVGAAITNAVGNLAARPLDMIFLCRRKIVASLRDYLKPIMASGACGLVFLFLGSSRRWIRVGIVGLFSWTSLLVSAMTAHELTCRSREARTSESSFLRRNRLKGLPWKGCSSVKHQHN